MSNDITLYDQASQPTDAVSQLSKLAMQGPKAVAVYSMALDRMDDQTKATHYQAIADQRNKENAEFVTLWAPKEQVINQLARNSDGTVITDSTGNPVYEQVLVPNRYQALFDAIATPLQQR